MGARRAGLRRAGRAHGAGDRRPDRPCRSRWRSWPGSPWVRWPFPSRREARAVGAPIAALIVGTGPRVGWSNQLGELTILVVAVAGLPGYADLSANGTPSVLALLAPGLLGLANRVTRGPGAAMVRRGRRPGGARGGRAGLALTALQIARRPGSNACSRWSTVCVCVLVHDRRCSGSRPPRPGPGGRRPRWARPGSSAYGGEQHRAAGRGARGRPVRAVRDGRCPRFRGQRTGPGTRGRRRPAGRGGPAPARARPARPGPTGRLLHPDSRPRRRSTTARSPSTRPRPITRWFAQRRARRSG